jgi:hypothetical protein
LCGEGRAHHSSPTSPEASLRKRLLFADGPDVEEVTRCHDDDAFIISCSFRNKNSLCSLRRAAAARHALRGERQEFERACQALIIDVTRLWSTGVALSGISAAHHHFVIYGITYDDLARRR